MLDTQLGRYIQTVSDQHHDMLKLHRRLQPPHKSKQDQLLEHNFHHHGEKRPLVKR